MPKRIALHLPNAPLGRYGCYCIWFPYGGYLMPDYMWGSVLGGFLYPITFNTLGLGGFASNFMLQVVSRDSYT